jgi:hypothetical protein
MKNPFLSLWLSAANRTLATARGHMMSHARRQQGIMLSAMFKGPLTSSAGRKRSKLRRRRAKL